MRARLLRFVADRLTSVVHRIEWRLADDVPEPDFGCSFCGHPTRAFLPICDDSCMRNWTLTRMLPKVSV